MLLTIGMVNCREFSLAWDYYYVRQICYIICNEAEEEEDEVALDSCAGNSAQMSSC